MLRRLNSEPGRCRCGGLLRAIDAHDLHVVEVIVNQHLTRGVAVLHRGPVEVLRVPYVPEQMDVHPRRVGPPDKRQMRTGAES